MKTPDITPHPAPVWASDQKLAREVGCYFNYKAYCGFDKDLSEMSAASNTPFRDAVEKVEAAANSVLDCLNTESGPINEMERSVILYDALRALAAARKREEVGT